MRHEGSEHPDPVVVLSDSDDDVPLSKRVKTSAQGPKQDAAEASGPETDNRSSSTEPSSSGGTDFEEVPEQSNKEPGTGVRVQSTKPESPGWQEVKSSRAEPTGRASQAPGRQTNTGPGRKPSTIDELRQHNPKLAANLDQALRRYIAYMNFCSYARRPILASHS